MLVLNSNICYHFSVRKKIIKIKWNYSSLTEMLETIWLWKKKDSCEVIYIYMRVCVCVCVCVCVSLYYHTFYFGNFYLQYPCNSESKRELNVK